MPMKQKYLFSHEVVLDRIQPYIDEIRLKKPHLQVSDLVDEAGYQYVDLVMEGGGVHGIALLGYLSVLEHVGIRFRGIGGTSAGSILALLLVAMSNNTKSFKTTYLLEQMLQKNFYDFVDGDSDAKQFIDALIKKSSKIKLAWKSLQVLDNIEKRLGLNPGFDFYQWVVSLLAEQNIKDYADLKQKLDTPLPIKHRFGLPLKEQEMITQLVIIASDVSTETKVQFPKMAPLYWHNINTLNPAHFVRASMSIPYFFEPCTIRQIPQEEHQLAKWMEWAAYRPRTTHDIPNEVTFVDGGIISNFPISEFHVRDRIPHAPTFGIKLGLDNAKHHIKGPIQLFLAIFNSARHALDYDFIVKNPDYRRLVAYIRIPEADYNWLDFNLPIEKKIALFQLGALSAKNFLLEFDWQSYKLFRKELLNS